MRNSVTIVAACVGIFLISTGLYKRRRKKKEQHVQDMMVMTHDSQTLVNLLYSIMENQARKGTRHHSFWHSSSSLDCVVHCIHPSIHPSISFHLDGISCNLCGAKHIRGIRYKCLNCSNFDLCELCEATSPECHYKWHVFCKIRIPVPTLTNAFTPLIPPMYPGGLSFAVDWSDLRELKAKTHFEEADISALLEKVNKPVDMVDSSPPSFLHWQLRMMGLL